MSLNAPDFRVDGKRALITGGSQGIGFACGIALAEAGARVTLAARTRANLELAAKEFTELGLSCEILQLDVTDSTAVKNAISQAEPFQILVNNAGTNRSMHLVDIDDEDLDAVFDLNVKATFYVTREVTKRLLAEKQAGSIITISSQMGFIGSPGRTLYCASKHALQGMTKALAWELGPNNIRVNTICPTFIKKEHMATTSEPATVRKDKLTYNPDFQTWVKQKIALDRFGRTDEIMGAVVFLASDASSLMTGSALMLDGGWTAV
jgi:NAD(P)-dependent dehydrogenase (short-subunit alcohol dehydrogenase family)